MSQSIMLKQNPMDLWLKNGKFMLKFMPSFAVNHTFAHNVSPMMKRDLILVSLLTYSGTRNAMSHYICSRVFPLDNMPKAYHVTFWSN